MPSIREKQTKDGRTFYEIQVSRGRSRSRLTSRWYPPEGWSQKAIDRELAKVAAEFERRCDNGEAISRAEQKEKDLLQKQEAAKIQTLRQYGERVFMPAKTVTISENSRSSFQGNLDRWIYPALGEMKMPDITAANISALLLDMQAQGKAHATCIKVYTVLKSLFKMAYLSDIVQKNPMDKVERPKQRKDEVRGIEAEAYTIEEVQTSNLADPSAIDSNAVELMKTGVLTVDDYFGFADRYDGNPTMLKLIGHYAKEAADSADDRKDKVALTVLAQDCAKGTGKTLKAWDSMMTAANYCSGRGGSGNRRITPGVTLSMGEWWEQLSGEIIENF